MSRIVTVGAGEKGDLLLGAWSRGGHETSAGEAGVSDAEIVLVDVAGAEFDLARISASLAGKIVIDCSNVTSVGDLRSKTSVAEELARASSAARVIKAFNVINAPTLRYLLKQRGPEVRDVYTSGYYCGDDATAKTIVAALISEINLDPVDCGPLANAVLLESLGVLSNYLETSLFGPIFALSVARQPHDRSPLDSLL